MLRGHRRAVDAAYDEGLANYFDSSIGNTTDRLRSFVKYVPRADLMRFLAFHEVFKNIIEAPGAIIECGVHLGAGLMSWAQLSAIYEPGNHIRQIVGFDTFSGFSAVQVQDQVADNELLTCGGMSVDAEQDLGRAIELYDLTRHINHIPRVKMVKGDACTSIARFIEDNPHTVVSLLHLDFDLFEPTCAALENFLPRMPRGAVILFDELNHPKWPGETLAALKTVGICNLRLKRFCFQPQLAWATIE